MKKQQSEDTIEETISKKEKLDRYMKQCQESINGFVATINYLKKNY